MGSGNSKPPTNTNTAFGPGISASIDALINEVAYTPRPTSYKKTALVIGINYTGTSAALTGCINDANNYKKILTEWGYDVTIMTDGSSGSLYPSKQNIINQIANKIASLVAGDSLVICYSGHGSRVTDTNGDEVSGKDSVIVPINYSSSGYLVDDTLRSLFSQAVTGSKIFAVFDACNSGSICDLRYNHFDTSYRQDPGEKNGDNIFRQSVITNTRYADTNADIISLSGCKDDQLSYETVLSNGARSGALTFFLLKYIYENTPSVSFSNMLNQVRSSLSSRGFNQNPSLMTGKNFDTSTSLADFLNI